MDPVDPYEQGCFKDGCPCAYLTTMKRSVKEWNERFSRD